MAVVVETVYDAYCDTCGAAFSSTHQLVPSPDEFSEYGWYTGDGNVLCPSCARREGAAAA